MIPEKAWASEEGKCLRELAELLDTAISKRFEDRLIKHYVENKTIEVKVYITDEDEPIFDETIYVSGTLRIGEVENFTLEFEPLRDESPALCRYGLRVKVYVRFPEIIKRNTKEIAEMLANLIEAAVRTHWRTPN